MFHNVRTVQRIVLDQSFINKSETSILSSVTAIERYPLLLEEKQKAARPLHLLSFDFFHLSPSLSNLPPVIPKNPRVLWSNLLISRLH